MKKIEFIIITELPNGDQERNSVFAERLESWGNSYIFYDSFDEIVCEIPVADNIAVSVFI